MTPLLAASGTNKTAVVNNNDQTPIWLSQKTRLQVLAHGPWPHDTVADPSNRLSGNQAAIQFGRRLFFSTRLSGDNTRSCVSCHAPAAAFASGRAIQEKKVNLDRNTPSLFNVRYQRWFGWTGANDSLWAQSIRPILNDQEMNLSKQTLRHIIQTSTFKTPYHHFFGEIETHSDDLVLINIGKALAAFQETLTTQKTPFDQFREAVKAQDWKLAANYSKEAQRGLQIFLGKGRCSVCHSGPRFSNSEFHNIGVSSIKTGTIDTGRYQGIIDLKQSSFNLDSDYNDDPKKTGARVVSNIATSLTNIGAFRVPSLRNVAKTAPYMHNGSLATLEDVIKHYVNIDTEQLHAETKAMLKPLRLTQPEINDLIAFLESLSD
ncbi:MAG: cytochrome-c peroxidase [Leucothrix sp.]